MPGVYTHTGPSHEGTVLTINQFSVSFNMTVITSPTLISKGISMKSIATIVIVLLVSLGIAAGQTPEKKDVKKAAATAKTTQPAKAKAPAKAAQPAKTKAAAKKAPAKKTAPAAKTVQSADTTQKKKTEPPTVEAAKPDTSATPTLKEYAKSKVNDVKATKDTLVQSGVEKMNKAKTNLGEKIKNFDPFKAKADSTKK